jgi:GTP-binding protein
VFRSVDAAYKAATADLSTPKLTRALIDAVAKQAPARSGIFRPKLRYAHQGGRNPPVIVIHGNALDKVQDSYRRYLEHMFREVFKLQGTPLRIQFNVSQNPFADRKAPEQNRRKPKAEEKPKPKSKAVVKPKPDTSAKPRARPRARTKPA